MTLFNRINSNHIHVRLNYGKADVCGTGPFMWIKANGSEFKQIIDPQKLIQYMRPPLNFLWRKILFYWVFGMIALSTFATLSFILIVNNYEDQTQIKRLSYAFLASIFFLVSIELLGIIICFQLFQNQLLNYIKKLNSTQLVHLGLQFYYPQGYCWGQNINVLGIRKLQGDIELIKDDIQEQEVQNRNVLVN